MRWAAGASRDGLRVSQPRVTALGLITLPADASPALGSARPRRSGLDGSVCSGELRTETIGSEHIYYVGCISVLQSFSALGLMVLLWENVSVEPCLCPQEKVLN